MDLRAPQLAPAAAPSSWYTGIMAVREASDTDLLDTVDWQPLFAGDPASELIPVPLYYLGRAADYEAGLAGRQITPHFESVDDLEDYCAANLDMLCTGGGQPAPRAGGGLAPSQ